MAAAMRASSGSIVAGGPRQMGMPAGGAARRATARPARVVVVRAVDEDAELEARLAKLKAAKGATTDAEKRAKRQQAAAGGAKGGAPGPKKPEYDFSNETVFWEGGPANGDLAFNTVMGATLVWLPLTFGAIGRRLFLKYRFTDKRISISDTFPGSGKQTDVAYQEVAEVRTVSRGLGAWGDMVVVLRNGDKLEFLALEKFGEIKDYILARRDELAGKGGAGGKGGKGGGSTKGSIMDLDADDAAVGLGGGGKGKGFA